MFLIDLTTDRPSRSVGLLASYCCDIVFRDVTPCGLVDACQRTFSEERTITVVGYMEPVGFLETSVPMYLTSEVKARMDEERGVYRVLVGKRREGNHWEDLGVDGWIILGWISNRWDVGIWTG